jgi:hypothetical protein
MTKAKIKLLARLLAATLTYNVMGTGADSEYLSDEDRESLCVELGNVAFKLAHKNEKALKCGDLDLLIDYVNNKS